MKKSNLICCLLFLFLGTTIAWADKYYQPGSYRGDFTPRKTLSDLAGTGVKFMIYDAAIQGNVDRTGFLRNNGVQFEHDKTKERDLLVYNESFVYTMEGHDDDQNGTFDWYAIKSIQTGLYVNINGKTDVANATDAKLYITDWANATNKSGVNMENWKYNIIANGNISGGDATTAFVVKYGDDTCWNGEVNSFVTSSQGHPYAFYVANEVTSGDYLEDLHIYSRCDLYSAQVIYGYIKSASQITSNYRFVDEGAFSNLIDGDGTSYNVTDWTTYNEGDDHYYQIDLGESVESLYLCMQRRADGKNAPVKYELQACATADGQYTPIGEYTTNLETAAFYSSDNIVLNGSYQHIRIVAKERTTTGFKCMGLSELYVLPGTQEIKDAIDFVNLATNDPIYTHASAKKYAEIVEKYNSKCPEAKLLSGVPIPGNKYRIYADAYENGVYVNKDIMAAGGNLSIKAAGSYHTAGNEQGKYEWYCEQTADGYLVFRNVADVDKYLGNGVTVDEPYKWSINTLKTQRHGVPLINIAMQYLAVYNNGSNWMGNVRDAQDQTVAPASIDHDNNADTDPQKVECGLCTDFVFIPVPYTNGEKKITINAGELAQRNIQLFFDVDQDGTAEVHSLPYSRMFVSKERFTTLKVKLLCPERHVFKGVKVNDAEELNTSIYTLENNELTFDFDQITSGDVLNLQFEIKKPFEFTDDANLAEKPALYIIRNMHKQGLMQQARPYRASEFPDIEIGGGDDENGDGEYDGPISSQTGKNYYAKFESRNANMSLVGIAGNTEDVTFGTEGLDAYTLFYFTKTEDTNTDQYYSVNIHNATTAMKCADDLHWKTNGVTWYVQPKNTGDYSGYNIGRTILNATNNPQDAWSCDHTDGDQIKLKNANESGTAWEFYQVPDNQAKRLLYEFITEVVAELDSTLAVKANSDDVNIDKAKVGYYQQVVTTMATRAEGFYNGTFTDPNGGDPISKLLQFAQNLHMLEHEIGYALFALPELTVEGEEDTNPHWYYVRNVNSDNYYATFNGVDNLMSLKQIETSGAKKLENLFYFVGSKNSYDGVVAGTNTTYQDFPGNNLIIDEYLHAHIHNFSAKGYTLVSKNVEVAMNRPTYTPGSIGNVATGLNLKNNQEWSIEFEYDLSGTTAYNAYGSSLLASGDKPLADGYSNAFQVYFKDDRSLVVKVNNSDDSNRFWHTQDYFSHIKVVITYSQQKVVVDVYNSLGEKETKTFTGVTLNDISTLSCAIPSEGFTLTNLGAYQVETMKWKEHQEATDKDQWYILPSSNANYPGLAIVIDEPNDTKMGWTNEQGSDTYVTTDLGNADNSTWMFEKVKDFNSHLDELLAKFDNADCVIYNPELAALMEAIRENIAIIREPATSYEDEERAFNEVYFTILDYETHNGKVAAEFKAPKASGLYTIRPYVEKNTDNALSVHIDATGNSYVTREVYNADATREDGTFDSRSVWMFEGTPANGDYLELNGLKLKNIHTNSYLTVGDILTASDNENDVTLSALGGSIAKIDVCDGFIPSGNYEVRYLKGEGFWGDALTEYPAGIGEQFESINGHQSVHCKSIAATIGTETNVSVTIRHEGGSHKLNILGVTLVAEDGTFTGVYRKGTAGDDPRSQTYEFTAVAPGIYTVNCYVANLNGGDNDKVQEAAGWIAINGDGVVNIEGTGKMAHIGGENTKWIIEEIKNPEENVYYLVSSLAAGTQPDTKAYSSLYLGHSAKVPTGITAYIVTGVQEDSKLDMVEITDGIIPAETGVILSSESVKTNQKFYYSSTSSTTNVDDNMLTGTTYTELVDCTNQDVYMLAKKNNRIALYWTYENRNAEGEKVTDANGSTNHNEGGYVQCNANKAYMVADEGSQANITMYSFFYGGTTTDINDITDETIDNINISGIFDLQGRKLNEITKPGIYIVNGKKVIVSNVE